LRSETAVIRSGAQAVLIVAFAVLAMVIAFRMIVKSRRK
jgi:hypothetical protein